MTLSYEKCKELKEAGFPEPEDWENKYAYCNHNDPDGIRCYETNTQLIHEDNDEGGLVGCDYQHRFHEVDNWIYAPTLSELIEACGEGFRTLTRDGNSWEAYYWDLRPDGVEYTKRGKTLEEAVVNLLLELYKEV